MHIRLTKSQRLLLCGGLIGLASLMLQACETVMKSGEDIRDKICGNWESMEGKPDVQTYLLVEEDGNLFINTGYRIDVAYNEAADVLTFSPNGDYVRKEERP